MDGWGYTLDNDAMDYASPQVFLFLLLFFSTEDEDYIYIINTLVHAWSLCISRIGRKGRNSLRIDRVPLVSQSWEGSGISIDIEINGQDYSELKKDEGWEEGTLQTGQK